MKQKTTITTILIVIAFALTSIATMAQTIGANQIKKGFGVKGDATNAVAVDTATGKIATQHYVNSHGAIGPTGPAGATGATGATGPTGTASQNLQQTLTIGNSTGNLSILSPSGRSYLSVLGSGLSGNTTALGYISGSANHYVGTTSAGPIVNYNDGTNNSFFRITATENQSTWTDGSSSGHFLIENGDLESYWSNGGNSGSLLINDTWTNVSHSSNLSLDAPVVQIANVPAWANTDTTISKVLFRNVSTGDIEWGGVVAPTGATGPTGPTGATGATGPTEDYFTIPISSLSLSPADGTTYYFNSATALSPATTATRFDFNFGYAFTVVGAYIGCYGNSTQGTTENNTLQIRNVTQGTSSLIGTFSSAGTTVEIESTTFTGLNISVAASDWICIQWDAATFSINPIGVRTTGWLICKRQ